MFNYFLEWRSEDRVAQRFKRKWQVQLLQVFCMLSIMIMNTQNVEAGPYDPIAATQTKWYVGGFTTTRRDDAETACGDLSKTHLGFWCEKFWGASLNFIGVYNGTCYNFRAGYNPTTMYGTYRGWLCPYDYTDTQGKFYSNAHFIPLALDLTCPANSHPYGSANASQVGQCMCNYPFVTDTTGTSCVVQCPTGQQPDATGLACVVIPPTVCPVGQKSHPYGGCMLDCAAGSFPNMDETACIPDSSPYCTIKPLNPLPTSISDACSNVLENLSSTQAQKDAACGTLKPELIADMACLTTKLEALSTAANIRPPLSLTQTAGVRTDAYQAHFREVWEKMENLTKLENENPAMKIACSARRLEIAKEKGCNNVGKCENACLPASVGQRSHCFRGRPAKPSSDAKHPKGKAIDVGSSEINRLKTVLSNQSPPQTIPQFLASPTGGCNVGQLGWGGTFTGNIDAVHFYVP